MKKITLLLLFLAIFKLEAQSLSENEDSKGFIENKGQFYNQYDKVNTNVLYLLNAPGMNVQLRKNGFSYDFYEIKQHSKKVKPASFMPVKGDSPEYTYTTKLHRIDFDFEGANPEVKVAGEEKSSSFNNYYNMPWKSDGVEMVHNYKKVVYRNLYKGVDLVFSVPDDTAKPVEYNFVVHKNGNIGDIKFRVRGAKNTIEGDKIKFYVRFGTVEETIPLSWTESGTEKIALDVNYRQISKNVYGFQSEKNLKGKEVIIDPVPIRLWGTYYGGYSWASAATITNDILKDVYVSGATGSSEFVATEGTFQSTYISGSTPSYVSKFSPDGVQLWGTYYGTSAGKIAIDNDFNVIFLGNTLNNAVNVTTPGSHQPTKNYLNDCYVVKLSPQGLRLWGSYYGGNGNDHAGSIVTDSNNNIYFDGTTGSTDHIASPGTLQPTLGGSFNNNMEGFLVKLSPEGTRIWGTYFGGENFDSLYGLNISDDDRLYASGGTSSDAMATPGTLRPNWDGTPEILVAEFDTSGNRIWSTYIGGNAVDSAIQSVLHDNILYMQVRTTSTSGLGTVGSFHPVVLDNESWELILAFDLENQSIEWGTYFNRQISGLAVNQGGEVFFCGETNEDTGISTPDAYMPVNTSNNKSYLIKLGQEGQRIWGTFYAGVLMWGACYVSVDSAGNIYMLGRTNNTTGMTTPGAFQPNISAQNSWAAYIVKFGDCSTTGALSSNSPVCVGQSINLNAQGGANYLWTGPDNFTSTLQNPVIPLATSRKAGTYSCAISGTVGCDATQTVDIVVGDTVPPIPALADLPDLTADCSIDVLHIPTATDGCDGIVNAITTDPLSYNIAGNYTINWNYTDSSGNTTRQQQRVIVNPPGTTVQPNVMLYSCTGTPFNLTEAQMLITTQADAAFAYYDEATEAQQQVNPITSPTSYTDTGDGQIFVVVTLPNGCKVPSVILLNNSLLPTIPGYTLEKCLGTNGQVFDLTESLPFIDSGSEYEIKFYASAADLLNNIAVPDASHFTTTTPTYTIYVRAKNSSGCTATGTIELKAGYATEADLTIYKECEGTGVVNFNLSTQEPAIIASLPPDSYNVSYYTIYADAINGTTNTISPVVNLTTGTTTVYYRFKASGSCPYIFKQDLVLIENPDFDLEPEYSFCIGESVTITLPNGFFMYKWSDGTVGQTAVFNTPGNYSAKVYTLTDGVLCEAIQYFTVSQYDAPLITDVVISDFSAPGNSITILPYSDNNLYSLNDLYYQQDNVFTGLAAGIYTVYVKDKGGCGKTRKTVALLDYPKYFTPNADGQRDYWHIKNAGFAKLLVTIYDRYGKLINTLQPNERGWDGTYNGQSLPATDYWFTIQQEGRPEFKGHFSLIR